MKIGLAPNRIKNAIFKQNFEIRSVNNEKVKIEYLYFLI